MRKISEERDYGQIVVIFFFIYLYFTVANRFRPFDYDPILLYLVTIVTYIVSICFFYGMSWLVNRKAQLSSFVFTLGYGLIPTLLWFTINSFLYYLLPPPRTLSVSGKVFSLVFITFSISLLLWKVILLYLAIRFSSKLNLFKIVYFLLIYMCALAPYIIYLYLMGIFRVPFI